MECEKANHNNKNPTINLQKGIAKKKCTGCKQTFPQFWPDTFRPCSLRSMASSVPGQGSHTTPLASCVGCKDKSCWHRTLCCLFTMASCSTLPSPSHCSSSKNSHVSLPLLITVLDRLQSCLFSHYDMISPAKPLLTDIISHSFLLCKSGSHGTALEKKKANDLGKKVWPLAILSLGVLSCLSHS